jgi:hypothetical protein
MPAAARHDRNVACRQMQGGGQFPSVEIDGPTHDHVDADAPVAGKLHGTPTDLPHIQKAPLKAGLTQQVGEKVHRT